MQDFPDPVLNVHYIEENPLDVDCVTSVTSGVCPLENGVFKRNNISRGSIGMPGYSKVPTILDVEVNGQLLPRRYEHPVNVCGSIPFRDLNIPAVTNFTVIIKYYNRSDDSNTGVITYTKIHEKRLTFEA